MIPILFEKGTRYFTGGGICRLSESLAWKVKEVLNGEFELEMTYPVAGIQYSEIKVDRIIFAKPNPFDPAQAFVIYAVTKPLRGKIKIYAEHVSHKQNKVTVSPFHAKTLKEALSAVQAAVVGSSPFQFVTSLDVINDINSNVPRTLRNSIYGRIISLYGGEIKYDNYHGEILSRRGSDKGFTVRYGKNLLDYNEKEDVSGIYDGIYPYYFNQDPEDEEEFEYVELPEKIIKIGTTSEKIMPLNLTSEFQEEPSVDELREAAQKYLEKNDINKGVLSIEIDFAILSQTEEYKNVLPPEKVELGDDVTIFIPLRGIKTKSRIVKTVYDGKKNRYESATVGEIQKEITDTIAGIKSETLINQEKIVMAEKAVAAVSARATDTEARVSVLTQWVEDYEGDVKNIAEIQALATANKASIEAIAKRTTAAETLISQIDQEVDTERARIDILAEFQTETEKNIAEIELDVTANESSIKTLAGRTTAAESAIAGVQSTAGENKASIEAIAKRTTAAETLISQIDQEVDTERARIDILAEFRTETENNIAEIELDVSENAAKVGLVVGTNASGNYVKGGIIAEAINGQTGVKIKADVLDIDVVKTLNAKADEVSLKSDKLLIETTGFKLENGIFTAISGTIGEFVIESDDTFNGTYVLRSRCGTKGTMSYNDGAYRTVTGYIFIVFTIRGIYYVVRNSVSYSSTLLAKVSAYQSPVFSDVEDPFSGGGDGGDI